jgi:hypothetical protein
VSPLKITVLLCIAQQRATLEAAFVSLPANQAPGEWLTRPLNVIERVLNKRVI